MMRWSLSDQGGSRYREGFGAFRPKYIGDSLPYDIDQYKFEPWNGCDPQSLRLRLEDGATRLELTVGQLMRHQPSDLRIKQCLEM